MVLATYRYYDPMATASHATTSPTENLDVARRLYDAMSDRRMDELRDSVTVDFVGRAAVGLPGGIGGTHRSRDAMIRDCWAVADRKFGAVPIPERMLCADDDHVVVLGHYTSRNPELPQFHAAFVHVLEIADGRVGSLVQVTDTREWPTDPDEQP